MTLVRNIYRGHGISFDDNELIAREKKDERNDGLTSDVGSMSILNFGRNIFLYRG